MVRLTGRMMVESNKEGTLEVFCNMRDGKTWHRRQTAANKRWSEWISMRNPQ